MQYSHSMSYNLYPIGHVALQNNTFTIKISDNYRDALLGLQDFSHATIFWWACHCDQESQRQQTIIKAPYTRSDDDVGVFATRSPARPNPIAITTVSLIEVNEDTGVITVPFIDAEHATPVLDIKPYFPASDRVSSCQIPNAFNHWPQCLEDSASFDWAKEFV